MTDKLDHVWRWSTTALCCLIGGSLQAESLPSSKQVAEHVLQHADQPDEVRNYQKLLRSLRHHELLEQEAASQAQQLSYQLQAAQALAELKRLGGKALPTVESATNRGIDLSRFSLVALTAQSEFWQAQLRYDNELIKVTAGQQIFGEVAVQLDAGGLRLSYEQQERLLTWF